MVISPRSHREKIIHRKHPVPEARNNSLQPRSLCCRQELPLISLDPSLHLIPCQYSMWMAGPLMGEWEDPSLLRLLLILQIPQWDSTPGAENTQKHFQLNS